MFTGVKNAEGKEGAGRMDHPFACQGDIVPCVVFPSQRLIRVCLQR